MPDVIVIGGGPAGTAAATRAAQLGAQVVLVERAHMGGNCVNRNCIPLNGLLATVQLQRRIARAGELGLRVAPPTLDVQAMVARTQQTSSEMRDGVESVLGSFGVDIIRGEARLVDARTVEVDGRRWQAGRAIVLATGAAWAPQPEGVAGLWRPDEALRLEEVPGRLAIWGGGAVEVELATLYAALGSRVTLIVDGPYPLPDEDYEVGQRLQGILQEQGVQILVNSTVTAATKVEEGLKVTLAGGKGSPAITVDRLLWAGRVPRTEGLGLAGVGVQTQGGAVVVDAHQRTSVAGIYAAGDVTGEPMLSSLATAGGVVAGENALGKDSRLDRRAVPRYAFTIPEVAAVGLTEDQAMDAGYDVEVANVSFATNARAAGLGENEGGVKIVADRKLGKVLGVHIVGACATELIGEAAMAIQLEALAEDFARAIRVHPTLSESAVEAGRAVLGQALYVPRL